MAEKLCDVKLSGGGAEPTLTSGSISSNTSRTYYLMPSDKLKSFFLGIQLQDTYYHCFDYDLETNILRYDKSEIPSSRVSYSNGNIQLDATGTTGSQWGGWYVLIDGNVDFS